MGTQKDMATVELRPSLDANISIFGIINIFLPQQLIRNKVGSEMLKIIVGIQIINSSLLLHMRKGKRHEIETLSATAQDYIILHSISHKSFNLRYC